MPLLSDRAANNEIDVILTHPLHSWSIRTMVGLIEDLRRCRSDEDLYVFQHQLAAHIADIEERHYTVRRVAGRLKKGGAKLPSYAPELGTDRNPHDRESWILESEVYERVWRTAGPVRRRAPTPPPVTIDGMAHRCLTCRHEPYIVAGGCVVPGADSAFCGCTVHRSAVPGGSSR